MAEYLKQLNEAQRKAVLAVDGPVMIIAGAGSGKTRVLTYRIAHLIAQNVDAFNILSLTFTNKAAREMKERVEQLVGPEAKNLWMGTFHSVFAKILRIEGDRLGYPANFTIYDSEDSRKLINQIIKEQNLDTEIYKPKSIQSRISALKNNLITPKNYPNFPEQVEYDDAARRPAFHQIYTLYMERCFRSGAMDFDDLLLKTNELLNRFPEVLSKYQSRFKYILVDEYQDTNHSQYLIVKALASRFENICVVGDDAQSIYAFRGANIRNILNFQKDYPDALILKLEQNYRSTQVIVEAANGVIKNNVDQLEKKVWTQNAAGEKIRVFRGASDTQEAAWVADDVLERQLREQLPYGQFAILYRTNAQSRSFEEALRKRGVPYRIYGGLSFYQRKEVKDVLAYLKLIINPKDEEAFRRVVNYPARGIGKTTLEKLTTASARYQTSLYNIARNPKQYTDTGYNAGAQTKLLDFAEMIESFQVMAQQYDAFELTKHVITSTGLLRELKQDQTPEGVSRVENTEELLNSVQEFVEGQSAPDVEGSADIGTYMEDVALITDLDQADEDETNQVSLMTIHLAKGLEFPHVYVVGLEEALFPSMMSMQSRADLEEERRLFYVALTRAEKSASLTWALMRYRWGKLIDNEPSRFLQELNEDLTEVLNADAPPSFHSTPVFNKGNNSFKSTQRTDARTGNARPSSSNVASNKSAETPTGMQAGRRNLTPLNTSQSSQTNATSGGYTGTIAEGMTVLHERFGKGVVDRIEGDSNNQKAIITFEVGSVKTLLLKFAQLKVLKK